MKKTTILLTILLFCLSVNAQYNNIIFDNQVGTVAVNNVLGEQGNGFLVMKHGSTIDDVRFGYPDKYLGGMLYDTIGGRGFGFMGRSGEPDLWVDNSSFSYLYHGWQWIPDSVWNFGHEAPLTNVKVGITSLTDTDNSYALAIRNRSRTKSHLMVRSDGQITIGSTDMPAGVTGDVNMNTSQGSVNFAPGQTRLTIWNPLCQSTSKIYPVIASDDKTAGDISGWSNTNNCVIKMRRAPTAETKVNFWITN